MLEKQYQLMDEVGELKSQLAAKQCELEAQICSKTKSTRDSRPNWP
jgi:hypothetical protein